MIDAKELEVKARGRWYGILTNLGVPESYLTGKHGPCLFCRGEDRWRWDNKNGSGSFFCNQCSPQSGSGITLVQKHLGISFPEALNRIQNIVGGCTKMQSKPQKDPKPALNKLWTASKPLSGSDFVSLYLHSRGLTLKPDCIRFCEKCYEKETQKEFPAMVARVYSSDGRSVSLHRTYLNGVDFGKLDIESPKKLMPGTELLNGGAIRLFQPEDRLFDSEVLGIAEGIETAISCAQMYGVAVWACISSTLMESWLPPENIKRIVVFGDNDSNFVGQKSAYILANKLYNKDLIVSVEVPDAVGTDFNDVLMAKDE